MFLIAFIAIHTKALRAVHIPNENMNNFVFYFLPFLGISSSA